MSYTLKLDLSDYERDALVMMLHTEVDRGERDGTTDSPFCKAMQKILDDVTSYDKSKERS